MWNRTIDKYRVFDPFEKMDTWFSWVEKPWDLAGTYIINQEKLCNYDYQKTDGGYEFVCEVPGYTKENIELSVKEDILAIEGKKDKKTFKFEVALSKNVDLTKITATCKDGILTIKLPVAEVNKPHKINIE